MELKVKNFYRKWLVLRETITEKDLDLFYGVVDIDGTVGRRMRLSKRGVGVHGNEDNPRFMAHWFTSGRCHQNVVFPLWLLNNKSVNGKYSIITNNLHSAIINTETNEIYDPTYTANKSGPNTTMKQFDSGYEIQNIAPHILHVDENMMNRFMDFLPEDQKELALRALKDHAEVLKSKEFVKA